MPHPHDQDIDIAGGTALQAMLLELLGQLGGQRTDRAMVGGNLLQTLLDRELAASRSPVSVVDQLLLSGEFGSVLPISQLGSERLSKFGISDKPAFGGLADIIAGFAAGALPQASILNAFGDQVLVQLPDGSKELVPIASLGGGEGLQTIQGRSGPFTVSRPDLASLQQRQSEFTGRLRPEQQASFGQAAQRLRLQAQQDVDAQRQPISLQGGGRLIIDPSTRRTAGRTIAGPARIVDRTGRTAATAGETAAEAVTVTPGAAATQRPGPLSQLRDTFRRIRGGLPVLARGSLPVPPAELTPMEQLSRDVRFRVQALMQADPNLSFAQATGFARNPGGFAAAAGSPLNPRQQAATAAGHAIQSDVRFRDPFVRAVSLGRAPTSAELSLEEFAQLPRWLQDVVRGIMGEANFGELGAFAPTGTNVRNRIVGALPI